MSVREYSLQFNSWLGSGQNFRASGSQYRGESNQMRPPLPRCTQCGKQHTGQCRMGLGICYTCGYPGHIMRDCPMRGDTSLAQPSGSAAGSSSSVRPPGQGPQAPMSRGRGRGGASSSNSPQNRIYALAGRQDQESSPDVVRVRVQDMEVESPTIQSIPVVNEFLDVFPDELPVSR
ncbi:PREDICTED: serine/arginine-rich splicing factor RS2Z32-like [Nicotiana attenuata]|uniref:serine/arginine-rich splicing factor RS2Z32-like n=1 Tax=Nicotiana attenuata TaxID=49451 RepID=UPI000905253B|nr:PREDICTED: serine/arginine-rich splicing factor RS2Z32-like [Nicotiana attenuata]